MENECNGEIYGDFAAVYDKFMDETPYEAWCERLIGLMEKYGVSKPVNVNMPGQVQGTREQTKETKAFKEQASGAQGIRTEASGAESEALLASERNLVVDLGCGTGTLTELLWRRGYDMIGIDNSPAMLNIAMQKREESGAGILYLLQDMRELELYSTVGTVLSVCDSVNYILKEEELCTVFSLVHNYLYPGGIFVFDFNTDYKYREIIGDATIAENREECSFIWENFYDSEEEINEYDLTIFVEEAAGLYRKFTETHFQRGYRAEQMVRFLEAAGFTVLEMMDADMGGAVTEQSERICVTAKKR